MPMPSKALVLHPFHSARGIYDGGGGRTTPQSPILPPLVHSECPRKETERPAAVYGASFPRNRCFTGCSSTVGDQEEEEEEEEEGQVIKTGADRHRVELDTEKKKKKKRKRRWR
ncbi:uncharacterized protein V6R79_007054 [Siganus canaliculatus]